MDVLLNELIGIAPVVEGNHGNDSKERLQEFCVYRIWRNMIIVHIFIFMSVNKTYACKRYIAT